MNEKGMMAAMKYVPEPRTGTWWPAREGECTTWYHRPPGWEQRHNRHERAQDERAQEQGRRRGPGLLVEAVYHVPLA